MLCVGEHYLLENLIGATTEKLIRKAPCSIMTLKD